jgi:hypothetical protein
MERGKKTIIGKKTCIVICWFLVGFIGAQISISYFDARTGVGDRIMEGIAFGIGYILYPLLAPYMLITSIASGKQKVMDYAIQVLGVLGILYILIPVVVSVIFDRMKKLRR